MPTQGALPGVASPPTKHHHCTQARIGEGPTTEANTAGGGGLEERSPQGTGVRGPASEVWWPPR